MTVSVPELTWEPPDGGVWEYDNSHQTGVATAVMAELMPRPYEQGFRRAFGELGLPLSHSEIAYINGRAYFSMFVHGAPRRPGNPPPDLVLKVLTRLLPSSRRRTRIAAQARSENQPMLSVARWKGMRSGWIDRVLGFQDVDLAALDDPALAAHLGGVFTLAREGLRLHFELINIAGAFGRYLVRVREWGLDPNVAMAAVMHGVPVHAEAHERMMAIVDSMEGTSVPSLDAVRSHSTVAARALDEYLRFHGSWATTDDANAPTLAEQPSVLLRAIANHRPPPAVDADARRSVRSEVPTADQAEFDRLSDEAQQAHAAMEDNSALLGSWPLGLLGRAMREAARRLAASGRLPDEDSVWALTSPEVAGLLDGSTSLDRSSIEARVGERAALVDIDPPRHLNGEPGSPPDSSVFPEPVAYWTDAMGTFIEAKMHATRATGVGTAPVTGRAVVVESAHEAFERIEPGDILVTRATNPAFNAIMPMLGGLITTDGGPACHAAVVARELQLSAIIGLGDAIDRLPDHATIRLDPQRATVTVVEAKATA